ncbi:MAG: hypothetical protein JXR94_14445 [Candidatus Hydrogenedentes bacterium]|nr:hypothetical protein [Candidatus Hydrogenedentota bacterium]
MPEIPFIETTIHVIDGDEVFAQPMRFLRPPRTGEWILIQGIQHRVEFIVHWLDENGYPRESIQVKAHGSAAETDLPVSKAVET